MLETKTNRKLLFDHLALERRFRVEDETFAGVAIGKRRDGMMSEICAVAVSTLKDATAEGDRPRARAVRDTKSSLVQRAMAFAFVGQRHA